MKMKEDEKISQYADRIETSVSVIRSSRGKIEDTTIVSKVLKTLLLIYAIKAFAI